MNRILILLSAALALAVCGAAQAQLYRWVDKDGKVRYGDTPPPGAKTSTIQGPPPAAAANPSGDAAKGPATPAEAEKDFRSRQTKAREAAEKAQEDEKLKADMRAACDQSKEYLRTLQSGQRIARTNAAGERYYLDDGQIQQEIAKEQQTVQKYCK